MPTEKSGFSRYKIPDEIDPVGDCCICVPVPNSPEYVAQFMGAIWRMGIQSHYERDDAHSGAVVAAKWRAIWHGVQSEMSCCRDRKETVNYNTYINNMQIKLIMIQLYQMYVAASLDVQVAFPDVPDTYDADPADAGSEVSERNVALCIACKSWVDTMCNAGQSFLHGALDDAMPIIVGAVAVPLIPIPITVFLGITVAVYGAVAYLELGREDYRDYLACGMYEALKGQSTTTQVAFDAAFDNLPVRPPPSETGGQDIARDIIEAWFRAVVNDLENYLAFVSVLGTAMSIAATVDPAECPCISCDDEAYTMDAALPSSFHFKPDAAIPGAIPDSPNGEGGEWLIGAGESGGGLQSTATGVGDITNCQPHIETDPNCPIVKVTYRVRYQNGGANRAKRLYFYDAAGAELSVQWDQGINPSGAWESRTTGDINVAGVSWVRIGEETRLAWDDWVRIDSITIFKG